MSLQCGDIDHVVVFQSQYLSGYIISHDTNHLIRRQYSDHMTQTNQSNCISESVFIGFFCVLVAVPVVSLSAFFLAIFLKTRQNKRKEAEVSFMLLLQMFFSRNLVRMLVLLKFLRITQSRKQKTLVHIINSILSTLIIIITNNLSLKMASTPKICLHS